MCLAGGAGRTWSADSRGNRSRARAAGRPELLPNTGQPGRLHPGGKGHATTNMGEQTTREQATGVQATEEQRERQAASLTAYGGNTMNQNGTPHHVSTPHRLAMLAITGLLALSACGQTETPQAISPNTSTNTPAPTTPVATTPAPTTPVVLNQMGCMYHPHIAGVMAGQPLVALRARRARPAMPGRRR